jgi:hypothetical protein
MTRYSRTLAALFLIAAVGAPSLGAGQGTCVTGGEPRRLVEQGVVVGLSVALQQSGLGNLAVLSADLCLSSNGWYYEIQYREKSGAIGATRIPAAGGGGGQPGYGGGGRRY